MPKSPEEEKSAPPHGTLPADIELSDLAVIHAFKKTLLILFKYNALLWPLDIEENDKAEINHHSSTVIKKGSLLEIKQYHLLLFFARQMSYLHSTSTDRCWFQLEWYFLKLCQDSSIQEKLSPYEITNVSAILHDFKRKPKQPPNLTAYIKTHVQP